MKKLILCISGMLLLTSLRLCAQDDLRIGMTTDEFKAKLPGVLPEKLDFNSSLILKEKLYDMDGQWNFSFSGSKLFSAEYIGKSEIITEEGFKKWTGSAKQIIDDYKKIYGKPDQYETGTLSFFDRNNNAYHEIIGKREVFYEAIWKTKTEDIKISCDFRSNYYEEFKENAPNGPNEWYNYHFQISHSLLPNAVDVGAGKKGRFWPGMDVNEFAKVFPTLFPDGVNVSGQWGREQELYGLKGGWAYQFENGKLSWIHYDKYFDEINEKNFNLCLSATDKLIADYTKKYGKPDTTITGNTKYVDPYEKHHWGYDVKEVRWKNVNGMKIKIEFTFMGGKGDYHFLVVINYFDKDYLYYD
ncbi:MAG: hypothetical protein V2A54_04885 [Bacteroidota bacterium]